MGGGKSFEWQQEVVNGYDRTVKGEFASFGYSLHDKVYALVDSYDGFVKPSPDATVLVLWSIIMSREP